MEEMNILDTEKRAYDHNAEGAEGTEETEEMEETNVCEVCGTEIGEQVEFLVTVGEDEYNACSKECARTIYSVKKR